MKRKILMWHGYQITLYDDLIKLVGCTPDKQDISVMYFDGSLDEFAERYKRAFMVYPEFIAVTHHSDFGQR